MKMPITSSIGYCQYDEPKCLNNNPFNIKKSTTNNPNVGAFRTQKLDQYTLTNLAKFMTLSFYSIWDTQEQNIYYSQNDLMSYFHQQQNPMNNVNYENFQDFCEKVLGATETSFSLCLCALKLIDRLRTRNGGVCGSDGFEYRIFIAAYIIAFKYFTERSINNKAWEPVCGMEVSQINIMEIEMLFGISFNINITSEEFIEWIQDIDMILCNNYATNIWYIQEIKPILSTIVKETNTIILNKNEESVAVHDSHDTNVECTKPSTSNLMKSNCRSNSVSSNNSTLVDSAVNELSFEEDSLIYDDSFAVLSPASVSSNKSSILTR
ncbi:hypothetical protein BCR36DRAFT_585542 [Piromyces finnis]|uniref:Cyclin N-terminal domain-containing protein n=1 Tax=Piromyces finnis TaxID=1754191 RepID=A0A1Y1V3V6_9FUNG|nr:hypothetical protein BCR36DRAFT_585542 [Piromyces finnis]|eukprot:ORX45789.1 hypothetical protein BCR36DRAFT_585542 [Piromyces finnis]